MKKKTLLIFMLVLFLLQAYMLFIPPAQGVQDDGSLYSILVENGLYRTSDANFDLVYGIEGEGSAVNTLPIGAVKWISNLFTENLFLVPLLALFYILVFDGGIYLAFRKMNFTTPWLPLLLMVAILLIFGDKGYMSYFNSLTYEGALLAYLSLFVGSSVHLALSGKKAVWNLILTALSLFLLVGTTREVFWLIIPSFLYLVRLLWVRKDALWRSVCILLALLTLFGNSMLFIKGDVRNSAVSRYHSVFYGVLLEKSEDEAKEILSDLDLPEEAAALRGTTFFEENWSEEEKIALSEDISYGKVASYYLTHPKEFYRLAKSTVANSFFVQQGYLGYSMWNDQRKPTLGIWNAIKKMLPIQNVFMMLLLFGAMVVASIIYRKEKPLLYDTGIWTLAASFISFPMAVIFFGFAQISKTVFPFALLTDTLIVLLIAWGVETLTVRQRKVKEKYGITQ